jgi:Meiotically up-regulated gene 113
MSDLGRDVADTFLRWSMEDAAGEELNGWIYFIGCREPLSIKIGFTAKDPLGRMKQLQTGNPSRLVMLGWFPGNQRLERQLHADMEEFRLSGEWFALDERANDILRGPMSCLHINNALTGHVPEDLQ